MLALLSSSPRATTTLCPLVVEKRTGEGARRTGRAEGVYGYSLILTNLDLSTPDNAAAVGHWYWRRTSIENVFRASRHGAALRHLPSGYREVNLAWMWAALLAVTTAGWLHELAATELPDGTLAGHGVRRQRH